MHIGGRQASRQLSLCLYSLQIIIIHFKIPTEGLTWECFGIFIPISRSVNYLQSSVSEWLNLLHLSEYITSLERQGYADIDSVTDITWEDLEDVGITKLGTFSYFLC